VLTSCALEQNNTRLLACGGLDTKIYVFTINKKEEPGKMTKSTELIGHVGIITCCHFLDENFFISGSNDSIFILWDISKEANVRQFVDHESEITCMDVCEEDRNLLVSGSDDTTIRVWDVRMKEPCTRIFEEGKSSISTVKFMPARYFNFKHHSKTTIVAGDDSGIIKLLDTKAIGKVAEYKQPEVEGVKALAFSASARLLFATYKSTDIFVWDTLSESISTKIDNAHRIQVTSLGKYCVIGSHFF